MKTLASVTAIVLASLSIVGTASASLINVSFGGAESSDGSALTSLLISSGYNDGSGVYLEGFDNNTECGLTQFTENLTGSYSLTKGHTKKKAAPPAGDNTCFMVTPSLSEAAPGKVIFDLTSFLTADNTNFQIDYLGFYWGSIDGKPKNMDSLTLYDVNGIVIETEFGSVITGDEILTKFDGKSGNQFSEQTNLYVNFYMPDHIGFTKFSLESSGKALEIDNVVIRTTVVSEPLPLALFSVGLLGLVVIRRRKIQ